MAERIVIVWTATFTAIITARAVLIEDNGEPWPWPICIFYFCTLLHVLWTAIHWAATFLINLGD